MAAVASGGGACGGAWVGWPTWKLCAFTDDMSSSNIMAHDSEQKITKTIG